MSVIPLLAVFIWLIQRFEVLRSLSPVSGVIQKCISFGRSPVVVEFNKSETSINCTQISPEQLL